MRVILLLLMSELSFSPPAVRIGVASARCGFGCGNPPFLSWPPPPHLRPVLVWHSWV